MVALPTHHRSPAQPARADGGVARGLASPGRHGLHGGDGDDTLVAGDDGDLLAGGSGDDVLYGGPGADSLDGQWGYDTLYGWGGGDWLFGEDDDDTIYVQNGDTALGGWGDDTVYVLGTGECTIDGGWYEQDVALLGDDSEAEPTNVEYVWYPEFWAVGYAVAEGEDYTLNLNGPEGLSLWTVDWGDGSEPETTEDAQDELTHLYTTAPSGPITATFTWNGREFAAWPLWPEIVPDAPTDLTATAVSGQEVTLTWTDNSDVEHGYLIEQRCGTGEFEAVAWAPANTEAWTLTGPFQNQIKYTYRVLARCNSQVSGAAESDGVMPNGPATLSAPTLVTAVCVSGQRVDVSWTDNAVGENRAGAFPSAGVRPSIPEPRRRRVQRPTP